MSHKPATLASIPTLAVIAGLAAAVAGCGTTGAPTTGSTQSSTRRSGDAPSRGHHARPRTKRPAHPRAQRRARPKRQLPEPRATVVYSSATNSLVQPQPAADSCHAIGSGLYSRPDPSCTPGALNPAVTQATIDTTICVSGWTETVRPPENVTEQEKAASMAAYGDAGSMEAYEYDHFVPLELGGATNDPRNLWPESGSSPNPKDAVEDDLRRAVCDRQITLAQAQREIVKDWTAAARR